MRATLQQLLQLTREVFDGTITRAELAGKSTHEQVFVATAIMLTDRHNYLDDNNMVRGVYSRVLETLLSAGTVNKLAGQRGFKSGEALVQAAKSANLYRPTPGRGGTKPITLDPPPELVALVQELGRTTAIDAFLRDSIAGVEQEKQWLAEFKRTSAAGVAMEEVVRQTVDQFGIEGLRELRSRIEQHLRNS